MKKYYPFSINKLGAVLASVISLPLVIHAAPLKSATVTETKNIVNLAKEGAGERAGKKGDTVVGKDRLWTGKKSRAEIDSLTK